MTGRRVVAYELIRADGSVTRTHYLDVPDGLSAEEADHYLRYNIEPVASHYAGWQYDIISLTESGQRKVVR